MMLVFSNKKEKKCSHLSFMQRTLSNNDQKLCYKHNKRKTAIYQIYNAWVYKEVIILNAAQQQTTSVLLYIYANFYFYYFYSQQ